MSKRTNASIMSDLMDLKATGAMGIIEDAFKADCIDETVTGDIEDVRIALGLQTGRTMPAKRYHHFSSLTPSQREEPKTGRNDPCPCGSGKKHKKCCGK
ncbi:MAG: SEC-C metal-binding domain-containing protein [Kiritimatiellaeota bacterium]|nr:SEC-C metal-binding domain-containing protein [Kiritimatiellota bacterium]